MKSYVLLLLLFKLISLVSFGQRADLRTDLEKMNLRAAVQSIREMSYMGDNSGEIIPGRVDSSLVNCIYYFQKDGRINSIINYLKTGGIAFIENFKYNSRGAEIEYSKSDGKKNILHKNLSEFDDLDFKTSVTTTDSRGQITSQQFSKYIFKDSNNYSYTRTNYKYGDNEVITVSFSDKHNLVRKVSEYPDFKDHFISYRYFYDSRNQLIRMTVEKEDGIVFSEQRYEYDDKGNISKLTEISKGVRPYVINSTYTYDEAGNWIKRITEKRLTEADGGHLIKARVVTARKIIYF